MIRSVPALARRSWILLFAFTLTGIAAELTPSEKAKNLASFELVWKTLQTRYWDESMGGLDWKAIHDQYRSEVARSSTLTEAREVMDRMIHLLPSSHLAIIPGTLYKTKELKQDTAAPDKKKALDTSIPDPNSDTDDEAGSTGISVTVIGEKVVVASVDPEMPAGKRAIHPGWSVAAVDGMQTARLFPGLGPEPSKRELAARVAESWLKGPPGSTVTVLFTTEAGKSHKEVFRREAERGETVQFGNLPPEHVAIEHKLLDNGVGYIRLNLFLDPVRVMPEIERAVTDFRKAPGMVLDLRNNPGGIGVMAMGIAGWFVSEEGRQLGTMTSRDSTLNFVINPRLEPYTGRLAVLVNEGSASTSEILAQGLKDLERAKIFGVKTAGAALPSNIIELPNGDRFQYPEANYVSVDGRVLEGNGVEPDVVVEQTVAALLAGRDLPLEAAQNWCREK